MAQKPDKAQKTEKPTERRKKKAREDGQVVRSAEVVPWLLVLVSTFVMPNFLGLAGEVLTDQMGEIRAAAADPSPAAAINAVQSAFFAVLTLTVPLLLGAMVIAFVATIGQVGPLLSVKAVRPQFKRLNPATGLKRIVSAKGQWEAAKAILRLVVVAIVAIPLMYETGTDLAAGGMTLGAGLEYIGGRLLELTRLVAFLALVVSAADYAMQKRNHIKDLMMSKQEIKDEQKQSDGDPLMKGRMRAAARELSRNRMLANVADASVIVVNPTHFSVALRYDPVIGVPTVVAKGVGSAALRLRQEGLEAMVPVVECKPLARALYRVCDVGSPVPNEMFQGVAVLLAFVQRLGVRRTLGGIHVLPHDTDALALPDRIRKAAERAMAADAAGSSPSRST
ncbi:MAG: EscU/YscU/HrcU family type III secretion system export apparatus switch protein [Actinomycetota bacterium]